MKLIAKTLFGLEDTLAAELINLGAGEVEKVNRAVLFSGDKLLLYKANYCLRTALSVLLPLSEFRIRSAKDLYSRCLKINWSEYMGYKQTFSVVPVVYSPFFPHTGYAGLLLKDAVADWFRQKKGIRPSVDTTDPDIVLNLHISNDLVTISIDSSVIPLYKRGYRKEQGTAPLNEVLAAGIILMTGWKGESHFYDPMCGSGTFLIEAALIANEIPPGSFRKFFGFQRWSDYDEEMFSSIIKKDADGIITNEMRIFGSDISDSAVASASKNVNSAGMSEAISLVKSDFKDLIPHSNSGIIIMNPPYGHRIKAREESNLYSLIGSTLKHNFAGFNAWVITADKEGLKNIGLKPALRKSLFNGSLDCILTKFELYQGSKRRTDAINI